MIAAAPAVVQRPYLQKGATQQTLCAESQRQYSEFKRLFSFIYRYVRACVFVCSNWSVIAQNAFGGQWRL